MSWLEFFEAFVLAITKCMETRSRAKIEAGLRKPRLRELLVINELLMDQGLRGRKLRKARREAMERLGAMSAGQITAIVDESAVMYREGEE